MKQGVIRNERVRLLLKKGHRCYRPRRTGERKKKSVRGCIVDRDLSVLALVIVQKGEKDIPGITDAERPRRLGPKRASKIRKLFGLTKEDDVRKFVIRREAGKKAKGKAPKIQRLVTPNTIRRKKLLKNNTIRKVQENREAKKEWQQRCVEYKAERQEARAHEVA